MGLVRSVIRMLPPAALFLAGYYVGTVRSGKYDCVFHNPASEAPAPNHDAALRASNPALERAYEQVIAYVNGSNNANH